MINQTTLIPAQTGYYMIETNEEHRLLERSPILAWAMQPVGDASGVNVLPVTMYGLDYRSAMLRPDGLVEWDGGHMLLSDFERMAGEAA